MTNEKFKHFFQQPTWRLWGEEREKDAVFTVYLKKVRYHRPTPSASSVSIMSHNHQEQKSKKPTKSFQ